MLGVRRVAACMQMAGMQSPHEMQWKRERFPAEKTRQTHVKLKFILTDMLFYACVHSCKYNSKAMCITLP